MGVDGNTNTNINGGGSGGNFGQAPGGADLSSGADADADDNSVSGDCSQVACKRGLSTSKSNGVWRVSCGGEVRCEGLRCSRLRWRCRQGQCTITCTGGVQAGNGNNNNNN